MRPDVDDAYLVQRAQEGYLDAYTELVKRHGSLAYRVALRMLGNPADAEDIAQEALTAAWQQLPRFRAGSEFTTWLYQIVTRRALNKINRNRPAGPLNEDSEADTAGPYEQLERNHTVDAVTAAVAALPAPQRAAIVLHHFEGLSVAQVAQITGSTPAATRSHLFRGRRTLVRTLQEWR